MALSHRHGQQGIPRAKRIEAQMQRVLGELVAREVRDPRVGNVTITAVSVSRGHVPRAVFFSCRSATSTGAGSARGPESRRGIPARRARPALQLRHMPRAASSSTTSRSRTAAPDELIHEAVKDDAARHSDDDDKPECQTRSFHRDRPASSCSTSRRALTSNAALQRVRRLFGADKAGHVGSLDPLATGHAADLPRRGDQGRRPNRVAASATIHRRSSARAPNRRCRRPRWSRRARCRRSTIARSSRAARLSSACSEQVPPMYSALKRDGQPLYELAPPAVEVERAARDDRHSSHRARPARAADELRARRRVRQGHLHPHARRGHRARAGYLRACDRGCGGLWSSRSATCPWARWSSWNALQPPARDAGLLRPTGASWTCRAVELAALAVQALAAGQDGRGAASRAGCRGERAARTTRQGAFPRAGQRAAGDGTAAAAAAVWSTLSKGPRRYNSAALRRFRRASRMRASQNGTQITGLRTRAELACHCRLKKRAESSRSSAATRHDTGSPEVQIALLSTHQRARRALHHAQA